MVNEHVQGELLADARCSLLRSAVYGLRRREALRGELPSVTCRALKTGRSGEEHSVPEEAISDEEQPDEPRGALLCGFCGEVVTFQSYTLSVEGSFEHVFTNPHGYVFRLGCFSAAPGAFPVGEYTEEFAWFSGTQWRFAVCAACLVHLGWKFVRTDGSAFYGLVLTKLKEG